MENLLENVVAKIMKDMDAQNMAFKTKEIDMATSVNTSVQKEYTKENQAIHFPTPCLPQPHFAILLSATAARMGQ